MDANTISEIDIETNRANIAYARSKKLIQSWLPPLEPSEESHLNTQDDDDSDFKSMPEKSGIGSTVGVDPDVSLVRRRGAGKDRLLQQLLGGRTQEEKKRMRDAASKDLSAKNTADSRALASRPKHKRGFEGDEDEDEGGRSSVFKSRKIKARTQDVRQPKQFTATAEEEEEQDGVMQSIVKHNKEKTGTSALDLDEEEKPAKRRKNTYLDELLTSRAKKSKKKKNKQ